MQARDLLVQVLRQHVDAERVLVGAREELDLRDRLVRERVAHHEARVARRVAEVEQPPLREHDHGVPVGEDPLVDLRLDPDPLDARHGGEAGHVDLVVEVADVADDGEVLHPLHLVDRDDVPVARRRDHDVGRVDHVVERPHLEALHQGLESADRVDLGDDDARALRPQ